MKISLLGAGRIGQVHGANIQAHPRAELFAVADVARDRAEALAHSLGTRDVSDPEEAVADPEVEAVFICSSTDTHVDMIELAARYHKPAFCEKPIDLDLGRVDECLERVRSSAIPLMIGFNRRFDPSFAALKRELAAGRIGRLEILRITSRDPEPPPADYIKVSGGIFRDMCIHDLDMARFLLPTEPVEVYATGSCLVDEAIGAAGDVDTAVVVLRTSDGVLCTIDNSRRAVYGYDQRIEAFGGAGMLRAENPRPTTLERSGAEAVQLDRPPWFFLERYAQAYRAELDAFIEGVAGRAPMEVTGEDGRAALALADAAARSLAEGRPIGL